MVALGTAMTILEIGISFTTVTKDNTVQYDNKWQSTIKDDKVKFDSKV
jgi:hypothetical protein